MSRMLPQVKQCWKRPLSMRVLTTKMDMKKRREICRELVQIIAEVEWGTKEDGYVVCLEDTV